MIVKGPLEKSTLQLEYGSARSLEAAWLVINPDGASLSAKMKNACEASAIDQYGDSPAAYSNLVCVGQTCSPVADCDASNLQFIVTCAYVPKGERDDSFQWTLSSTLNQIQTNVDRNGQLLSTYYVYPDTHPERPGIAETQGATISVPEPEWTLTARGIIQTSNLQRETGQYVGAVNNTSFFGEEPGHWLCTGVETSLWDMSTTPDRYRVQYTWQFSRLRWYYNIWFVDPTTGKTPANVVPGIGYKTVYWHRTANFNNVDRYAIA